MVTAIRDKRKKLLINEEEILQRWKEHLEEVFNVDSAGTELLDGTGAVAVQQLPEITSEISKGRDERCY